MARFFRDVPWPVLLLVIGIVAPFELSVYLGSIRLPPHRIAILLFILPALCKLASGRDLRASTYDVVFLVYAAWTVGVLIKHEGFGAGGEFGGALALESFGAYVIARAYIRDRRAFEATIRLLFGAVVVLGLVALIESISGQMLLRRWLQSITGVYHPLKIEHRLGLTRATTTFEHPILYGTFCASLFAYGWLVSRTYVAAGLRSGYVAAATYLSLSSAPLLCIMVQTAMIFWERVTRRLQFRMTVSIVLAVVLYVLIELASSRGAVEAIVTRLTIDSGTAYYRLQIWTYGLDNVWDNPLWGIGRSNWTRVWWMASNSVDAFWLVIMIRVGIPAALLLVLAILLLLSGVYRGARRQNPETARLSHAWMISILAMICVALTVHYWDSSHAYFFMLLGAGGWIADPMPARRPLAVRRPRATGRAVARGPRPYYAHALAAAR
jgi:hypothetical protein